MRIKSSEGDLWSCLVVFLVPRLQRHTTGLLFYLSHFRYFILFRLYSIMPYVVDVVRHKYHIVILNMYCFLNIFSLASVHYVEAFSLALCFIIVNIQRLFILLFVNIQTLFIHSTINNRI